MIVITLTKVPNSLRGDLTKWCQEIQTGVYVGNVSARIRDLLWERINGNIGSGEATLVYNTNNEIGYQFKTTRKDRQVVDFDGIPIMAHLNSMPTEVKHGFSNAAKKHRSRIRSSYLLDKINEKKSVENFIVLDIETTGLNAESDEVISIGAVKQEGNNYDEFYKLVKTDHEIPDKITQLTGITESEIQLCGIELKIVMKLLRDFVSDYPIIGYNIKFDMEFLKQANLKCGEDGFNNKSYDLLPIVKRVNRFLDNYRLDTVFNEYGIINCVPHNALSDARATLELVNKLMKN